MWSFTVPSSRACVRVSPDVPCILSSTGLIFVCHTCLLGTHIAPLVAAHSNFGNLVTLKKYKNTGAPLIGSRLLPNNSALTGEVSFGDRKASQVFAALATKSLCPF